MMGNDAKRQNCPHYHLRRREVVGSGRQKTPQICGELHFFAKEMIKR